MKKYKTINNKRLTLIGAGPGDPELITLKAIKALSKADIVLYDALVNKAILDYIPKHIEKIYVGKRSNHHTYSQDEINQLIVYYALLNKHVVRLKGGDPFVFGRGYEEKEFAQTFNIPVDVIPGISSSIAVPESQGIPLTKRGINESFWVITGTTKSGKISKDINLAAQSSATIVILMGMKKLREIAQVFSDLNKGDTPIAIIQNGTLKNEKIALGVIDTIVDIATSKKIGAPAIIIAGEVVGLHKTFDKSYLSLLNSLNKN